MSRALVESSLFFQQTRMASFAVNSWTGSEVESVAEETGSNTYSFIIDPELQSQYCPWLFLHFALDVLSLTLLDAVSSLVTLVASVFFVLDTFS